MSKKRNILTLFFDETSKDFNIREVGRKLKIAPATASKELKILERKNVLKGRDERFLKLYKANLDSDLYKDMKSYYTMRKIKEISFIDYINRFYVTSAIVLFGAGKEGTDIEITPLDVAVIGEQKEKLPEKYKEKFETQLNRKLNIYFFKNLKDASPELINKIINGITLFGEIKLY